MTDVVARIFGNVANPVVTAVMMAAAATTGDPTFAALSIPAGATAGVLAEKAVANLRNAWRAEGVEGFVEEVEAQSGVPMTETLEGLTDRPARKLLGEAAAVAADSVDEWRVRMLARAFLAGASDGSRVDEMRMLVGILAGLDTVDARMLALVQVGGHIRLAESDPELLRVGEIVLHRLVRAGLVKERSTDGFRQMSDLGRNVCDLLGNLDGFKFD